MLSSIKYEKRTTYHVESMKNLDALKDINDDSFEMADHLDLPNEFPDDVTYTETEIIQSSQQTCSQIVGRNISGAASGDDSRNHNQDTDKRTLDNSKHLDRISVVSSALGYKKGLTEVK